MTMPGRSGFSLLIATVALSAVPSAPPALSPDIACGTLSSVTHGNARLLLFDQLQRFSLQRQREFEPQIAIWEPAVWRDKTRLGVRFLDGEEEVARRVLNVASEWTTDLSLAFELSSQDSAEIRVTFTGSGLSSKVGREALTVACCAPTMHLGGLRGARDDQEWRAFVLHEFGHALGALHEHQRRDAPLSWNRPVVYKYYWDHYGWQEPDVDRHVIDPFLATELVQSARFDRESVMMYPVLPGFTKEGFVQPWNAVLTTWDRDVVKMLYGKP